jgi:hypothetical protein
MIHKIDMADSRKMCGEKEGISPVVAKSCALSGGERQKVRAFVSVNLWKPIGQIKSILLVDTAFKAPVPMPSEAFEERQTIFQVLHRG